MVTIDGVVGAQRGVTDSRGVSYIFKTTVSPPPLTHQMGVRIGPGWIRETCHGVWTRVRGGR